MSVDCKVKKGSFEETEKQPFGHFERSEKSLK